MAEPSKFLTWVKRALGTVIGLVSGAAVMYVSPLVDRVIKPARPLANYAVETDGLTAVFHNRYAGEGWWDFGDGSPLEPAIPQDTTITHTYSRAGTFTAKLMVRNFVGEEHERTVPVEVTVAATNSPAPAIVSLDAAPVSVSRTAPATFRVTAQTTNAERCLWDLGGDRPVEVVSDGTNKQERFITFDSPGQHVIQLVALSGNQAVKKTVAVQVDPPAAGAIIARLKVRDGGTRAEKRQFTESIPLNLSRQTRGSQGIDRKLDARVGFTITEAKLGVVDPAMQSLKVTITQGGKSVHLTGTVLPTSAMLESANPITVPVMLTQERQLKMTPAEKEVSAMITFPGMATLPIPAIPADVTLPQRTLVLELRNASGQFWQQPLPASSSFTDAQGKRFTLKAIPVGNEVRVEVVPGAVGLTGREK